jgi:hypothetical protein
MIASHHKQIYVEAYRPFADNPLACAEVTDVNHTVYRKEFGGGVGYFSASLWPCWHRIMVSTVTVTFVSNKPFTRDEAASIAAEIIAGKWRAYFIDLSLI